MDCESNEESAFVTRSADAEPGSLRKRPRKLEKKWTTDEDQIMVAMMEKRAAIWDNKSSEYRDRYMKNKCWEEIAEITKHSVMDAKNHWNTIKSRFNLERKKVMIKSKSGQSGTSYSSKFELYKPLQFLLPVKSRLPRKTATNLTIENKSEDFDYSISSLASPSTSEYDDGGITRRTPSCTFQNCKSSTPPAPSHNVQPKTVSNEIQEQEIAREKRWKNVFSEYIFCELERYEEQDAQDLKNAILNVCINFQPRRYVGRESQSNEDVKFEL